MVRVINDFRDQNDEYDSGDEALMDSVTRFLTSLIFLIFEYYFTKLSPL